MLSPSKKIGKAAFLLIILASSIVVGFGLQSSIIVPSTGSIYYPPEAQVLFEDEFESGDFSAWNGTTTTAGNKATVAALDPYEGAYHAYFQTDAIASGVNYAYSFVELSPTVSEVYARAYFYIVDGLSLDDNGDMFGLIAFEVGEQPQCTFGVHRSGGVDRFNIVGLNGISAVTGSADAVYPVEGEWYCLEFYIRVHTTKGEYRAYINDVEQITITNVNTASYGSGVTCVRFGLTYTANIQHTVEVYCDSVAVSTRPVGLLYAFGVIGDDANVPAIWNFYWLFGNQSISYMALRSSDVKDSADVALFDGLVVWTRNGGYNSTVIKQFAQTHVVISHVRDFCNVLYPSLSSSLQVVATETVTYVKDCGNFRKGDLVEMRNETGNIDQLATVSASGLAIFNNVTAIARYDANRIALFYMKGVQAKSGLYVMDLDATTPETEWAGIWHLFPAVKMVRDFPTGKYARWFAYGIEHWTYDQVMAKLSSWVANAPRGMNASLIRIGKSVLGRDINATRFGNGSRYIVVDGAIHGNEKHVTPALLRLLEVVQENFEANGYWKDKLSQVGVIVIPILNPDGYVSHSRYNANGKDLNRQFPPGKNTTEPEAWALRWLWGNYSTIIYVNLHTGRHWQPLDYFYAYSYAATTVDVGGFSKQNIYWTGDEFKSLNHWGYYDEESWSTNPLPIGKVRLFCVNSGTWGQADLGASYLHNISAYLVESFVWSSSYSGVNHKARQMLWAMDYYVTTVLGHISQLDRLRNDDFLVVTQGDIKSLSWTDKLLLEIDTSDLSYASNSITKIDVGDRTKPLYVFIDNEEKGESDGWTYYNGLITVTGAKNKIEVEW